MAELITVEAFEAAGLAGWEWGGDAIRAELRPGSFTAAGQLAAAIARAADEADHHPDVDLRYPDKVLVTLSSHDTGGVTQRDLDLARTISGLV